MNSRWHEQKSIAIHRRKKGTSIVVIEKELGIPRSTLSGWFKDVVLSSTAKHKLEMSRIEALRQAQRKGSQYHRDQKEQRILLSKLAAEKVARRLTSEKSDTLELALSMLYFGEGAKNEKGLVLGNSNPDILLFFLSALRLLYGIDESRIRCQLNLRADQIIITEIAYWSNILTLPKKCFSRAYTDKRTLGRKTYRGYHGVCVIQYGDVALQRKLMYLYQLYCQKVVRRATGG